MSRRTCEGDKQGGDACRQAPLVGGRFCFWHDADHAEEAAEARRLGGQRRRRERIVSGAYDFEGLGSVGSVRRLVEVAVVDALGMENSVARVRALDYLAQVASKLLEVGQFEERLEALESVLEPRVTALRGRAGRT